MFKKGVGTSIICTPLFPSCFQTPNSVPQYAVLSKKKKRSYLCGNWDWVEDILYLCPTHTACTLHPTVPNLTKHPQAFANPELLSLLIIEALSAICPATAKRTSECRLLRVLTSLRWIEKLDSVINSSTMK